MDDRMPAPFFFVLVGFIAACMVADMRTRRIPNVLTMPAMLTGVVLHGRFTGDGGIAASVVGAAIAIGVLTVPFALGGIGGGDVKMMGAIGAFVGPRLALLSLATGMVLGGVVMLVHLTRRGRLREKLERTTSMLAEALGGHTLAPLRLAADAPDAVTLPYSVPLGLGALAVLVLAR